MQQQHDLRQVAALNFRRVALRPVQLAALRPQPMARAGSGPPGPSLALLGRGAADLLDEQSPDSALRIESRHSSQAAVYHMPDAVNRHGSLRHVGRDYYFAEWIRGKRQI